MKTQHKSKAKMNVSKSAVDPGALEDARRAAQDAPGSTVPRTPAGVDTEVVARARRRHFSNAEKRRILQAVDARENDEQVGIDEDGDLGGEAVIVAEIDLLDGHRVVLVDDRHDIAAGKEVGEGVARQGSDEQSHAIPCPPSR